MNKLYKYLPYNIQVQYDNNIWDLRGCHSESYSTKVWLGSKENEQVNHTCLAEMSEIKPILRPFSDLVKELPLTKAAAEMIGMQEGEIVNPLIAAHVLNFNKSQRENYKETYEEALKKLKSFEQVEIKNQICIFWQEPKKYGSQETEYVFGFNTQTLQFGSLIISLTEKYPSDFTSHTNYQELILDFLRAMHFTVDFKEGDYIKLGN